MPLPRPWPRRAHQNHCLVNVRSRWLRVVVFIVFFFAAMVMKSHILVQHITLGAFPLSTWSKFQRAHAILCLSSVENIHPPFLHSCIAPPLPCVGKTDQEILIGLCV